MGDQLATPLHWPISWPRTAPHARESGAFKGTFDSIRRELVHEINQIALGPQARTHILSSIVISTNLPLRRDGYPSASGPRPTDPGVAVYFTRKKQAVCFACDKYNEVWKNMRAISKTIEAMRGIERWGSSQLLDKAFSGFAALPPKSGPDCWETLDIPPNSPEQVILDAYRRKAREAHPDNGGTHEQFISITSAKDIALATMKHAA